MAFSTRKAGLPFKIKLGTNSDLSGQADNFSAYYIKDSDGTKTDITNAFSEDENTAGLYMVECTIDEVGEYTVVINNDSIGMGNHEHSVVITAASIDDVKNVVDDLTTTLATVAADVDGLNGQDLQDIKDTLASIKTLIDDEDGETVNSVMEFVAKIDEALQDGGSGLAALSGFTDDIENMLLGTEYLADGETANPFYDENNPGVAKESTVVNKFADLATQLTNAKDSVLNSISDAQTSIEDKIAAVQSVVDANKATLEDAGYGLEALKALIDDVQTSVSAGETNIVNLLEDAGYGLEAIKNELVSRFDSVDAKLLEIEDKVESGNTATAYRVFV